MPSSVVGWVGTSILISIGLDGVCCTDGGSDIALWLDWEETAEVSVVDKGQLGAFVLLEPSDDAGNVPCAAPRSSLRDVVLPRRLLKDRLLSVSTDEPRYFFLRMRYLVLF